MTEQRDMQPATPSVQHEPGGAAPDRDAESHVRRQVLSLLAAWVDDVLSPEEPPPGIAPEVWGRLQAEGADRPGDLDGTGCDLYSLWSAMIAQTQENRLQGRAFDRLREKIGPVEELAGAVDVVRRAQQESESLRDDRDQQLAGAARQQVCEELVDLLLDVRDRLVRGRDLARACLADRGGGEGRAHWLRLQSRCNGIGDLLARLVRLGRGAPPSRDTQALQALLDGQELALQRLDEALRELGITPITCRGLPFDPRRMRAVEVDASADAAPGTVLDVFRIGYEWDGRVYRAAEVKVARPTECS